MVDDDLAAGETGIALGAAGDEGTRGIDVEGDVVEVESGGREHRVDHLLTDLCLELFLRDVGVVLGRDHDRIDGLRW